MYKVLVQNSCSCFVKNGIAQTQEFDSKDEAQQYASSLIEKMRTTFCKKHEFSMSEQFGDFSIFIKPRR